MQSIIIVTFTKLLATKIVANNISESANNVLIFLSAEWFSSSISFKSEGEREKNAISDAEAKAETPSKSPANAIAIIAETDGAVTDIFNTSVNKKTIKQGAGSKI